MKTAIAFLTARVFPAAGVLFLAACASSVPSETGGSVADGYYRVERGDNLYRIGLRFNQSAATLARWNNLADPAQIEVGQLLRVRPETAVRGAAQTAASAARLRWPADGPLLARFDGRGNKGIDIGGQRGDPVYAAGAGQVLYAGDGVRGYGRMVLVSHSSGLLTAYANNDRLLVAKGQRVAVGQKIAEMGSSDTDRVKLHFEVRLSGKAVNPEPYLPPR
ncbi:peptidoglycan DD-metalloendopeptidase family protein [Neisseria leonii]|uniref:Peptidoglycan DD-metalloendopeptidase family protein n=1 Tax=Neisseria leonii TaxID=2995413 RepID=A0A9X4E3D0_9NEIS|nr:peptidoglycan DD-metalloendopeptidase family protein [Neisseria sp. 51.81]MDD9327964.1 peptidoglycan DD-metalloendopeptidase family protein [Neisseria sp. 51.81]